MTDTTYVQQLRKTILGEFYFGAMCHEPSDGLRSRLMRVEGSRDILSRARRECRVITVKKSTDSTTAIYSLFSKSDWNEQRERATRRRQRRQLRPGSHDACRSDWQQPALAVATRGVLHGGVGR